MITEIKGCDLPLEEANMMDEIWKEMSGYEDMYEISNFSNIRNKKTKRPIKQFKNKHGYVTVRIYKDGIGLTKTVHRLVAKTFIPNPENFPEINHKDENKANNIASNLE